MTDKPDHGALIQKCFEAGAKLIHVENYGLFRALIGAHTHIVPRDMWGWGDTFEEALTKLHDALRERK